MDNCAWCIPCRQCCFGSNELPDARLCSGAEDLLDRSVSGHVEIASVDIVYAARHVQCAIVAASLARKTATRVPLVKPLNLLPCDLGLKSLQPVMRS
jgi:hypothetical protein